MVGEHQPECDQRTYFPKEPVLPPQTWRERMLECEGSYALLVQAFKPL